jgi:four helix bundle protein
MTPFERLEAWQLCHSLVLAVYRLTANWPPTERYGLVSQVRRAAISIPTNVAEGAAKRGSREFRRFLDISLGSLSELTYLLRLARDLGYLSAEEFDGIENLRERAGQLTWGLYRAISRKAT